MSTRNGKHPGIDLMSSEIKTNLAYKPVFCEHAPLKPGIDQPLPQCVIISHGSSRSNM